MKQPQKHRGVALIMSLVMLVMVSLLATMTMKSAISSESISGNVRLTQLAHQSAEMALRYCEDMVISNATGTPKSGGPAVQSAGSEPLWQKVKSTWDEDNTAVHVLPLNYVNNNSDAPYQRPPECLAEHLVDSGDPAYNRRFVITARGFGPEVKALESGATDRRPKGSEVFLQSTIDM